MKTINVAGVYRGPILEHAVSTTKLGLPQFVALMRATEVYDFEGACWKAYGEENCELTAYLVLFSGKRETTFHVQNLIHAVEWDGKSLLGLSKMDLVDVGVQFTVIEDEYQGEIKYKATRINHFDDVPQTGTVRKLSEEDVRALSTQFDALLVKNAAPAKPVSAPVKAPVKTLVAATPKVKRIAKPQVNAVPEPIAEQVPDEEVPGDPDYNVDTLPQPEVDPAIQAAAEQNSMPGPTAAKTVVKKKGMEKPEAWAKCVNMKAPGITIQDLTKSWGMAVRGIGKPETSFINDDWAAVCVTVCNECGVF